MQVIGFELTKLSPSRGFSIELGSACRFDWFKTGNSTFHDALPSWRYCWGWFNRRHWKCQLDAFCPSCGWMDCNPSCCVSHVCCRIFLRRIFSTGIEYSSKLLQYDVLAGRIIEDFSL